MSMSEYFAPAEKRYRDEVISATFGHLAPEFGRMYTGFIIFTEGEYGHITIIQCHFKDLNDSPWFFENMNDFIEKHLAKPGAVRRFDGTYHARFIKSRDIIAGTFVGRFTTLVPAHTEKE